MRFDLNDEQRAVRDTVDELCRTRWSSSAARRHGAGEDGGDALWNALRDAGWTGVSVAEEHGGHGLGTLELALVCESLGRVLAPGTFFGNAAAAVVVAQAGDEAQRKRWLPGFASGTSPGALGVLDDSGSALVYDAQDAEVYVLARRGRALVAAARSCRVEPVEGVDITRRLARVTPGDAAELDGDVNAALDRVEVALSAELVGVANAALDLAVEHARTRQQFGHPIGAYQAVSHRCADMLLDVESARSAMLFAAWTADNEPDGLAVAASIAKVAAAQGAWRTATSSLQVHGGIGFTWEHDCHLLLRRASASGHMLEGSDWHLDRVAARRGLGVA